MFGVETMARVVAQAALIVTARILGPGEYGTVSIAMAVFSIALIFADMGIGDSAVQRLTRRRNGVAIYWREVTVVRLLSTLPMVFIGSAIFLISDDVAVKLSGLLVAAMPLALLLTNRVIGARISEHFPSAAGWSSVLMICQWVGALIGALLMPTAMAAVLGILGLLLLASLFALRVDSIRVPSRRKAVSWILRGVPFILTAGAIALYTRGDRIVVGLIAGAAAAGTYTAAYSMIMIVLIAGAALQSALLPRLLRERQQQMGGWIFRAVIIAASSLPVAIVLWLLAPWIVGVLYGDSYESAGNILRILCPLVVLYLVNPFLTSCLIARQEQATVAKVALTNLGISIIAYTVLTNLYGAHGAAVASVSIELIGTALTAFYLFRHSKHGLAAMKQLA